VKLGGYDEEFKGHREFCWGELMGNDSGSVTRELTYTGHNYQVT
jgi:hypothetical protein